MIRSLAVLLASATTAALLAVPATPAATAAPAKADRPVASREIAFDVVNINETTVACQGDGRAHVVRARLVGPRRVVTGHGGVETFNVLVHDAGTGAWFWNLRGKGVDPTYDYATQLARRGETSVVIDRLGYDRSPLRNGDDTCLGAQASMLHQVVQHLYAGLYSVTGRPRASRPHAAHIVLHGHGTGATIARLEASQFDDVQALVLMSPPSTSPSTLALQTLRGQASACLRGADYAAYGDARTYRRLLFASAPATVQRAATQQRNSTPCGDVTSVVPTVLMGQGGRVEVPTLVLSGAADARRGGDGITGTTSARVVRRTYAGAGSALPLERQAPAVRRAVLSFVGSLDNRVR